MILETYRSYIERKIREIALKNTTKLYDAPDFSNSGWWIFKTGAGVTVAKLYYNFQADHVSCRTGKGNVFEGVLCKVGDNSDESILFEFVEGKLKRGV